MNELIFVFVQNEGRFQNKEILISYNIKKASTFKKLEIKHKIRQTILKVTNTNEISMSPDVKGEELTTKNKKGVG